jgi:hypothetical protein
VITTAIGMLAEIVAGTDTDEDSRATPSGLTWRRASAAAPLRRQAAAWALRKDRSRHGADQPAGRED